MAITRRIFISDLHLGTDRSVQTHFPYCWLNKHAKYLARFLGQLTRRSDVRELVILGDMLDDWVIPANLDPDPSSAYQDTFDAICRAQQNRLIVNYLKLLASPDSGVQVSYVPGNHDMAVTRDFLETTFPGIRWIGNHHPDTHIYHGGNISAEHGHRFCLFNAPDDLTGNPNQLPLGYYISRCAAREEMQDGRGLDVVATIARFIKELFREDQDIPVAVLGTVAREAGMRSNSSFHMPKGQAPLTVAQVKQRFADLIPQWNASHQHPHNDAIQALLADAGALDPVIWRVYGKRTEENPHIVICGHTHAYGMWGGDRHGYASLVRGDDSEQPGWDGYKYIYANSGTWVDSTSLRTYVETEERPEQGRHYVRVKKFTSDGKSVEMMGSYTRL